MKFQELELEEVRKVNGGFRHVEKIDLDGDGSWDVKYVYRSNGPFKTKYR